MGQVPAPKGLILMKSLSRRDPDRLLHMFGCDCAERALYQLQKGDDTVPVIFGELLRLKREWLEGACASEQLRSVRAEAEALISSSFGEEECGQKMLWRSYVAAGEEDAFRAAKDASMGAVLGNAELVTEGMDEEDDARIDLWRETLQREKSWQKKRYLWLKKTYQWAGGRMTFLIREGTIETPDEVALYVD